MIETTLKCHVCNKELTRIDWDVPDDGPIPPTRTMTLECPDVHSNVTYDPVRKQIIGYVIYTEDERGRRYKVKGWRDTNSTQFYLKTGPKPWDYKQALSIKRFLAFKPNKDGQLQGDAIFRKLKTLLVFS